MVSQNFQPVILAGGRGTRFPDIVNQKPKCLIPIGPYPMLWYPLRILKNHGFTETIVIVMDSQRIEIQQAIEKYQLGIYIEFFALPNASDLGTADALKHIKDKIKPNHDILIVSGDVVADVDLYPLLRMFRQHDASVAIQLFRSVHLADVKIPGPKTKHKPDRDLIGIHPTTNRLLFLASTSDFDENLLFSSHRLRKNGSITIYSNLVDSHIYVIRNWVMDFLCDDSLKVSTPFSTIKGELLPYIVKKQISRPEAPFSEKLTSEVNVNTKIQDIFQYVTSSDISISQKITDSSVFNDSLSKSAYNSDKIRCYAIISPKESFGVRVNNMLGYCTANKKIFNVLEKIKCDSNEFISASAVIKSTQFTGNAVGDGTVVSEKTSISGTLFGSNCNISPKTKISDSIVMNNVIIEELVVIENCIICDKAVIRKGSILKQCLIGPGFTVQEGTVKEKMHLTSDDGLMEID